MVENGDYRVINKDEFVRRMMFEMGLNKRKRNNKIVAEYKTHQLIYQTYEIDRAYKNRKRKGR